MLLTAIRMEIDVEFGQLERRRREIVMNAAYPYPSGEKIIESREKKRRERNEQNYQIRRQNNAYKNQTH
jgi:hypothetical protein